MRNKVAIVGGADSKRFAPFNDPSWEIWGLNNLYSIFPRKDRWFEIHHILFDGAEQYYRRGQKEYQGKNVNDYLRDLDSLRCPVYMQKEWAIVSKSRRYPLQKLTCKYGNYFTSSISYMLALAIEEKFKEIGIWGYNAGIDNEYSQQKACIEYFIGLARGMGRKIHLPSDTMLLFEPTKYGFGEEYTLEFIRAKELALNLKNQRG